MLISAMVMKIMYLHFSQMQITLNYIILTLITLLAYFAVSRNANLFVHERLTNLHRNLKCTFRKENFLKNEKLKEREFLQLFVETSPNRLSSLPKKDNKQKKHLIEVLVYLPFKSLELNW